MPPSFILGGGLEKGIVGLQWEYTERKGVICGLEETEG